MCGKDVIYGIHIILWMVPCMVLSSDILCAIKCWFLLTVVLILYFGSGFGGGFEVVVEDEAGSDYGIIFNKDIKGVVNLGIGDSAGWGGFVKDDSKEVKLEVEIFEGLMVLGLIKTLVVNYLVVIM